jgi:hypothetical protein
MRCKRVVEATRRRSRMTNQGFVPRAAAANGDVELDAPGLGVSIAEWDSGAGVIGVQVRFLKSMSVAEQGRGCAVDARKPGALRSGRVGTWRPSTV